MAEKDCSLSSNLSNAAKAGLVGAIIVGAIRLVKGAKTPPPKPPSHAKK